MGPSLKLLDIQKKSVLTYYAQYHENDMSMNQYMKNQGNQKELFGFRGKYSTSEERRLRQSIEYYMRKLRANENGFLETELMKHGFTTKAGTPIQTPTPPGENDDDDDDDDDDEERGEEVHDDDAANRKRK
jgi:hypothetical protein